MAEKYQKDSKAAAFKKHKGILAGNAGISMFLAVAELNSVVLAFTDVNRVTERLTNLLFL